MSRKTILSGVAAFAITGFFLWLALRKVEFGALGATLASARLGWLIPMVALVYLDLFVRAARWQVLLSRTWPASLADLFKLEAIGLAVNNVLLLRLGEFARAGLAARRFGIPVATALASVVVERVLDVAAMLILFVLASHLAPGIAPVSIVRAAVALFAGALGALILLAALGRSLAAGGRSERVLRHWPKILKIVTQLALGAAVLRAPQAAAKAVVLSLILWIGDAALYWAGAYALGLGGIMDYPRAVLTLSLAGMSSAIPAAPGSFGTFETFVASILRTFGAGPEAALAYALLTHMIMYLLVTITGLIFLSREGISLSQLRKEVEHNK